jgi:hypothetical protein
MATAKKTVKDFDTFRKSHDKNFIIPAKLSAAIEALGKGGWEYEAEFIKAIPVSTTDCARFREQFNEHVVVVESGRKKIWCGSKALATKMREAL